MDQSVKNLFRFFAVSLLIMLAAAALNFAVDPLQIFRPARLLTAVYSQDSRIQNAGLIKSQEFDTVFMGTSLAIHFRQSDIDRILGVQSLKLAMSGSSSREQTFVLAAAMARGPKRVIWEVDDWIFHDAPEIDANTHLPADLYRGTRPPAATTSSQAVFKVWREPEEVVRPGTNVCIVIATGGHGGRFQSLAEDRRGKIRSMKRWPVGERN